MPMQRQGLIQRSFGAGELAPALHARADQVKYATGLKTCRNFLVKRAGGLDNRPGLRYVAACKTASPSVALMPYVSELAGQSVLIEVGAGYMRFVQNGAQVNVAGVAAWSAIVAYTWGDIVVSGGVNYWAVIPSLNQVPPNATFWYPLTGTILEIGHPFGADLPAWAQSGRVITLTHEAHPPMELIYVGLTTWQLKPIVTQPSNIPPTAVGLTPGGAGTRRFAYIVTSAAADSYEESEGSGAVINNLCAVPTETAPNLITWTPVSGAAEYYIYCDPFNNGTFGFIGTATGAGAAAFHDTGFVPDFTVTPPVPRLMFGTATNYPKVSGSYQQRRFFGYTTATPDGVFGSRTGFPSNFGISSPLQDDDAVTFRIAGARHNPVRHLIGLKSLVVLTDAGAWNITGDGQGVIKPNAINPDQKTYSGAHPTRPVVVGNAILYLQSRGSVLHDLQFDVAVEGLGGRDLTIFSSHLVDGHTITGLDYAQTPDSIVWCVRDDGVLLGLTYIREQDVWGWHRHDTDGLFWSVCVVPETAADTVYVIVRRTVNGSTVRYIERLAPRAIKTWDTDVFFVDAGLSYSGAPANNIAGLNHLEAKIVAVVGDGSVIFDGDPSSPRAASFTVTGGTLPAPLPAAYANIHAGLPIRFAEIETLDLDVQGADARGKQKRVGFVNVLVDASSRSLLAGPDATHLRRYAAPAYEGAADAFTGQIELSLTSQFDSYGRVLIRQTDPLPITILGVIPDVNLGG